MKLKLTYDIQAPDGTRIITNTNDFLKFGMVCKSTGDILVYTCHKDDFNFDLNDVTWVKLSRSELISLSKLK